LFDKLFLGMDFDSSHTNFHLVEKVMLAYLEQHGQGHAFRAHKRKVTLSI